MGIVRELLIKIGFVSDKKAINATNSAITGFKTRFALAATAATYAFSKIAGFFSDVATATLDSQDLAKSLGISLKELTQLGQGLKSFRLDDSQIQSTLKHVNKLFVDFRTGASNELREIARGFNFEIDREAGPVALFRQILEGIAKIENEQDRIRQTANIFGDVLAPRIAEIAISLGKLDASVTSFGDLGQKTQDSVPALLEYQKAVMGLTNSWNEFVLSISQTVFPVLQKLIEYLSIASDFYRNIFTGNTDGLKSTFQKGSKFVQPLFDAVGEGFNNASNFFDGLLQKPQWLKNFETYAENRIEDQPMGAFSTNGMSSPNVVNNIDIQVPYGTSEDQARFMSDQVQQAVDNSIWETFRQIQNNNPTVE